MVKSRKIGSKFNRCVKSVRSTVKARKGSNKESAAIAICTKSVLQTRGKTMKRYRKGRLVTQRKLRGGGFVEAAKTNAAALKERAKANAAAIREKAAGLAGDFREKAVEIYKNKEGVARANEIFADEDSEKLLVELREYFKEGGEFDELEHALEDKIRKEKNLDPETPVEINPATPVELKFSKSSYYNPQAWNRIINKLKDAVKETAKDVNTIAKGHMLQQAEEIVGTENITDTMTDDDVINRAKQMGDFPTEAAFVENVRAIVAEQQQSLDIFGKSTRPGDTVPYYDVSNVKKAIESIMFVRQENRKKAQARGPYGNSNVGISGDTYRTAELGRDLLGFF